MYSKTVAVALSGLALAGNAVAWQQHQSTLISLAKRQTTPSCDTLPANSGNTQADGANDIGCSLLNIAGAIAGNTNCASSTSAPCANFASAVGSCTTASDVSSLVGCACTSNVFEALSSCASCVGQSQQVQYYQTGCQQLGANVSGGSSSAASSTSGSSSSATSSSAATSAATSATSAASSAISSAASSVASQASSVVAQVTSGAASPSSTGKNAATTVKAGSGLLSLVFGAFFVLA